MKFYETVRPVADYLNKELECSCGRTHFAPIKDINIGKGAINALPGYMKKYGYKKAYILCDRITYDIVGRKLEGLIAEEGLSSHTLIIKHMGFDEATLGEIVINKSDDCDLMIGCGTGSITDMLRYSSFKLGLPCFTVATGAPMDGFSASVGIMNVNNLKATMPAHSTEVIIGDTDILSGAPFRMTVAGYGDLIGKVSSLNDWRIAVRVDGEHYCENMDKLVTAYVDKIIGETDALRDRDPKAVGDVMDALLLTGATISLYGTSRAISGSEHHMSHYWEVLGDQRGKPYAMHGEQVAVGTVLSLMVNEELSKMTPDFDSARARAKEYRFEAWDKEIRRAYGNAADAIIDLEKASGKNETEGRLKRLDRIEEHWDELRAMTGSVYPSEKIAALFAALGCPGTPKALGLTPDIIRDTLLYCKDTRKIYTVLRLASDLGVMEEIADRIIGKLAEKGEI